MFFLLPSYTTKEASSSERRAYNFQNTLAAAINAIGAASINTFIRVAAPTFWMRWRRCFLGCWLFCVLFFHMVFALGIIIQVGEREGKCSVWGCFFLFYFFFYTVVHQIDGQQVERWFTELIRFVNCFHLSAFKRGGKKWCGWWSVWWPHQTFTDRRGASHPFSGPWMNHSCLCILAAIQKDQSQHRPLSRFNNVAPRKC